MAWNRKTENKVLIAVNAVLFLLVLFLYSQCCGSSRYGNTFWNLMPDTLSGYYHKDKYFMDDTITSDTLVADTVVHVDSLGMKGDINCMDIVMCIDVTGSMSGILNTVKSQALNFYPDIKRECADLGKNVLNMRIKVIAFRDYMDNSADAIDETPFYKIPSQERHFRSYVNGLRPNGGGDDPESDMEAIALAIQSNWNKEIGHRRHVILLWTDAPTHYIGKAKGVCPKRIPDSFSGLTRLWNSSIISQTGKCLIVFSPADKSWDGIKSWHNTFIKNVKPGAGLSDVDYKKIIKTIAESV